GMENPKAPTNGFWCCVAGCVAACVYFGGYIAVRSAAVLNKHTICSGGGVDVWVSGHGSAAPFFELAFQPLCRCEGKFWIWNYSGEDVEPLLIPLPAR